ncbi:hypothetical protein PIB30_077515 [Stylosanthes scabra]|uniref:Uncharacterized protein n=1 Tax=Stylosanthes scabra TaxID=79078 RepID=A0ABU6VSM2_9FABA|nr:hypothetical protein [Stylosanthes scabra]
MVDFIDPYCDPFFTLRFINVAIDTKKALNPTIHPQPPPTPNLHRASVHHNIRRASLNLQPPSTRISVAPSSRSVLLLPSLPVHFNHVSWLANPLADRERAEGEEERGRMAPARLGAAVAVVDGRGREREEIKERHD